MNQGSLFDDDSIIGRLKDLLREEMLGSLGKKKGPKCPVCGTMVKLYRRALNEDMARVLIWLYHQQRLYPGEYHHVEQGMDRTSRDFPRLLMWRMIERRPSEDGKKKESGCYRITEYGQPFVQRQTSARSHVYRVKGMAPGQHLADFFGRRPADRLVRIDECFHRLHDYERLMRGEL